MKLNRFLEWVVIIGAYLTLFTAFIISTNLFFPFITGKAFFFRIIVEIIFAAWLILVVRNKSYLPKRSPLLLSFVAFVVVMFFADLFGVNRLASFWSNFERMEGFVTIAHLLAYFIVLISVFRTKRVWRNFFRLSVVLSLGMAFYGFLQLGGKVDIRQGGFRLDGTLGNATYLAVYTLFNIFFAIYLFAKEKIVYWKSLYVISLIFNLITLYYTGTRGAMLGLIGGVLLSSIIIAISSKDKVKLKNFSIGVILAVTLFVGLFVSLKNTDFVNNSITLQRFATISLEDRTTLSRFLIWGIAFDAFKEKPILGYGQSNFNILFDKGYDPRLYNQEQWFDRAHNIIMDMLVAGGILGLLTYIGILISAVYLIWKRSNLSTIEMSVLTGLLSAYFFQNLFVFDNLMSYIFFISVLALINFEGVGIRVKEGDRVNKSLTNSLSFLVLISMFFVIYFVNGPLYKSSIKLIDALQMAYNSQTKQLLTAYGTPEKNLQLYKEAIALNTSGNPEIRTQLIQSATNVLRSNNIPDSFKLEFNEYAVNQLKMQIEEFPIDAKYPFILATYYGQIGDFENAVIYFEKALELSPRKQIISSALAISYAKEGDLSKGISLAKETYEMERRSKEAWHAYVTILDMSGDEEGTNDLLNEAISRKEYDWVIGFRTMKVVEDLNNFDKYVDLANVYVEAGRLIEGVRVMEESKKNVPAKSKDADIKISEIRSLLYK